MAEGSIKASDKELKQLTELVEKGRSTVSFIGMLSVISIFVGITASIFSLYDLKNQNQNQEQLIDINETKNAVVSLNSKNHDLIGRLGRSEARFSQMQTEPDTVFIQQTHSLGLVSSMLVDLVDTVVVSDTILVQNWKMFEEDKNRIKYQLCELFGTPWPPDRIDVRIQLYAKSDSSVSKVIASILSRDFVNKVSLKN